MAYLKNIGQGQVLKLADEVAVAPGQVVSKTLAQNDAVSITLFAFSKGEEISTHSSEGVAMVLVLDGCGELTVGGVKHVCSAGESIVMPASVPHGRTIAEMTPALTLQLYKSKRALRSFQRFLCGVRR